jgi:hypothetical protein
MKDSLRADSKLLKLARTVLKLTCFNLPFHAHGAVASSREWITVVTCIGLKMSVIGSNSTSHFWTNRQTIRTLNEFQSTILEIYSLVSDETRSKADADEIGGETG